MAEKKIAKETAKVEKNSLVDEILEDAKELIKDKTEKKTRGRKASKVEEITPEIEVKPIEAEEKVEEKAVEEVSEPVVTADLPQEDEIKAKAELKEEKRIARAEKKKAHKKAKNASKKGSNQNNRKELKAKEPVNKHLDDFGIKSSELNSADDLVLMNDEQREYEIFKELHVGMNNRQLFWGTVYGVEPSKNFGACVNVNFKGVKVIIPISEYFEDNFDFGIRFKELVDLKEKSQDKNEIRELEKQIVRRKFNFANFQLGAEVCFVVKAVTYNKEDFIDEDGNRQHKIICVASRKEGMALLRDIHIFHTERKAGFDEKDTIKVGDYALAHVIAVKEDSMVVEVFGVETRINAKDVSDDYTENCKDRFKPGDKMRVKIRKFYMPNNGRPLYISLTGRTRDVEKIVRSMKVGQTILGKVDGINRAKKVYNIHLKNGAYAGVLFSNIQGHKTLNIGDTVSVYVTKINDNFVYGVAYKV